MPKRPGAKAKKDTWIAYAAELEAAAAASAARISELSEELEASPSVVRQLKRRIHGLTGGR